MKEKTSTLLFEGTSMVYFPSTLVMAPVLVPFTMIVTPGMGSLSAEVTVPVILICDCDTDCTSLRLAGDSTM